MQRQKDHSSPFSVVGLQYVFIPCTFLKTFFDNEHALYFCIQGKTDRLFLKLKKGCILTFHFIMLCF